MNKAFKTIGKIALILFILGVGLMGIAVVLGVQNRSFTNNRFFKFIINSKVEKLEYTVVDDFDSIDLEVDAADVVIKEGEEFAIEYTLYEGATFEVKNNTLYINKYEGEYINIGINLETKDTYLTIYIPKDKDINIKKMDVDMGDIEIKNDSGWRLNNINIDADMGDIEIEGKVEGKIDIEADMGDVDIKGYLQCDISVGADMGDVDICTYYNEEYYNYEIDVDMGEKNIEKNGGEMLEGDYRFDIEVECDMGDVNLTFEDK
ncbi:MAG: DUF4097 family beta strand repeat protein [Lachnospiraceae bacterium]|nr:DUF4097 family beta strand repeat protein [Lachnospiraceae bacterium]